MSLRLLALLLRNDLRLAWRDFASRRWRASLAASFVLLLLALGHGLVLPLCALADAPPAPAWQASIWLLLAGIMFGVAVQQSLTLLYARGDLDLLLAAPVPVATILLARITSIAVTAAAPVALFVLPLLNGAWLFLDPSYAFGYVVWPLLALLLAAAGLGFTLLLVRTFGLRRGRIIAQILGAVGGAGIYLLLQIPHVIPATARPRVLAGVESVLQWPLLTLPARAGRGEPWALVLLGGAAGLAVLAAAGSLARSFLHGGQLAEAAVTPPARRAAPAWRARPFVVAVKKDWRLLRRDPLLLTHLLPAILYLVPAALVFGRHLGAGVLGLCAVLAAAHFASLLTRLSADGEECWDLIRMSPASDLVQRRAKMIAGLVLPAIAATALCLAAGLAGQPLLALVSWVTSLAVAVAISRLQVAQIRPTPRRDVIRRRSGGFLSGQILAGLLIASGTAAVGLFARQAWLATAVTFGITLLLLMAAFTLVKFQETRFPES